MAEEYSTMGEEYSTSKCLFEFLFCNMQAASFPTVFEWNVNILDGLWISGDGLKIEIFLTVCSGQ